jgi:murein DD-endopeptidase MepM/ murein hydrolase activator NlpD
MMRRPRATRLSLAILLVLGLQAGAGQARAAPTLTHQWPPYHWPVRPFDQQHPLQAAFGDPRTINKSQPFGRTGPWVDGAHSFHNGVDVAAEPGTRVYPVVSGSVVTATEGKIVVRTADGRSFQYYHLDRAVHRGQFAVAGRTVLGRITERRCHVHLAEIDNGRIQNPLAPGHLEPYRDWARPSAKGVYIDNGHSVRLVGDRPVAPHDRLVVAAVDPPARPLRAPYSGLPQTAALVEWRLSRWPARTPWRIAADFRQTEPSPPDFWNVYAPGTYQNCPVFDHRLFSGTPGRYLFHVDLDRSRFRVGRYRLEVRVADVRGNSSTASWQLRLASS